GILDVASDHHADDLVLRRFLEPALADGAAVANAFPKVDVAIGGPVLEIRNYSHRTEFRDISFTLRQGEILGIYGLIGAGRSEL
ncbi:hypothetical protein AB9F38_34930, partial [Rhizobium leguminosarum]